MLNKWVLYHQYLFDNLTVLQIFRIKHGAARFKGCNDYQAVIKGKTITLGNGTGIFYRDNRSRVDSEVSF